MNQAGEWQFDGLIGPTHNYAGLSPGNVASSANAGQVSNPREAALQGLAKMKFVRDLGMHQAFLPPHKRPMISVLQQISFEGGMQKQLDEAYHTAPHLLASVFSSSYMWAANAATVIPSMDAGDGRLHLVPANLVSNFHRSIEPGFTTRLLRRIFADEARFRVHDPLPATTRLSDEGAANHMRISDRGHTTEGLHIFVYGTGGIMEKRPSKFPARQQFDACRTIFRMGQIKPECQFFVQQNPDAIDAGVFHNDVIAMNTTRFMIAHQKAFVEQAAKVNEWKRAAQKIGWQFIEVMENELSMDAAVRSYFFNSQLLELPDGGVVVVAPQECAENEQAAAVFASLSGGNGPLQAVHYRDVRESMRNGGGPACLRLRVVMTDEEARAIHPGVILTDAKYDALVAWVKKHYRDRLALEDLRDAAFVKELDAAYAELEQIVGMPGLYEKL